MLPAPRQVLVIHDDGRWYLAALVDAYRDATGWRAVVRYSVAPGMQYQRGVSYDELRPASGEEGR